MVIKQLHRTITWYHKGIYIEDLQTIYELADRIISGTITIEIASGNHEYHCSNWEDFIENNHSITHIIQSFIYEESAISARRMRITLRLNTITILYYPANQQHSAFFAHLENTIQPLIRNHFKFLVPILVPKLIRFTPRPQKKHVLKRVFLSLVVTSITVIISLVFTDLWAWLKLFFTHD